VVFILGGVFSHSEQFDSLAEILPGLAFHAVAMGLGMLCLTRSAHKQTS